MILFEFKFFIFVLIKECVCVWIVVDVFFLNIINMLFLFIFFVGLLGWVFVCVLIVRSGIIVSVKVDNFVFIVLFYK